MRKHKKISCSHLIPKIVAGAIMAAGYLMLVLLSSASAAESSNDIADRLAAQKQYLERNSTELDAIDGRIAAAEQYLDQRRMDLADASARLRDAEERYSATIRLYEGRISAIYKLGDSNFYNVVLTSDDFTDALSRVSYLSKVSENDQRLVERVKADAESVRVIHTRVEELKQTQSGDVNALQQRKQELQGLIRTGSSEIDKQTAELNKARQEEDAAAESFDGGGFYGGLMGPSITVSNEPPPGLRPSGMTISGMASWYGPGFQGNTTANGEIYNMYGFTAAHKSMAFNTWLKVTHDGRSVFVRINDRGPYVGGRILDLSYSSAQAIGISGVGFVSAEIYR